MLDFIYQNSADSLMLKKAEPGHRAGTDSWDPNMCS